MPYVTSVERLAIRRGMQQGLEQGRLEGRMEGKLEGRQEGLERLLVKRFDRWTDRILEASTVDAVFEGH